METTLVSPSLGWVTVGIMYLLLMLRDYNTRELVESRQYAELSAETMLGLWLVDRVSTDNLTGDVFVYLYRNKHEGTCFVEILSTHPDVEAFQLLKPGSEIELDKELHPTQKLECVTCGYLQLAFPD